MEKGRLIWIGKLDEGLRPISLLPAIGKVLDKLLANRTAIYIESTGKLSKNQYGFRKGHTTIQTIEEVLGTIQKSKKDGKHFLIITLDMKNAFNSAWGPSILFEMKRMKVPKNLLELARDFLAGTRIYAGEKEQEMERRCPLGSCLAPILWIIMMEGWFREMINVKKS